MADLTKLRDEIFTTLSTTSNLTANEKQKLRDRFVSAYQGEFDSLVEGGMTDNATNRGKFVAQKWIDFAKVIYTSEKLKADRAAITPEELG